MNMYIPEIGDKIILIKDWTFKLYREWRNNSLFNFLMLDNDQLLVNEEIKGYHNKYANITIPKGCKLTIDRIYIRKGQLVYSSITFYLIPSKEFKDEFNSENVKVLKDILSNMEIKPKTKIKKRLRFWARLSDVNQIQFKKIIE